MSQKSTPPALSRRAALSAAGTGALAAAGLTLLPRAAAASPEAAAALLGKWTSGAAPTEGKVTVDAPEIAENGNTVPITVSVDHPMTADSYIRSIHVVATGNPAPEVASFHFGPKAAQAYAKFRVRLAKTQEVRAVAVDNKGNAYGGGKDIKVTIGGCGG